MSLLRTKLKISLRAKFIKGFILSLKKPFGYFLTRS